MALAKLPQDDANSADPLGGGESIFAEINITPLTDIFLVLLIIFMVTSSVLVQAGTRSGIKVNLPKGQSHELAERTKHIVVAIGRDGQVYVGGRVMTAKEIAAAFAKARESSPDTQVILEADEGVPHGRVVAVMELAKREGLNRLAIATRGERKQ